MLSHPITEMMNDIEERAAGSAWKRFRIGLGNGFLSRGWSGGLGFFRHHSGLGSGITQETRLKSSLGESPHRVTGGFHQQLGEATNLCGIQPWVDQFHQTG